MDTGDKRIWIAPWGEHLPVTLKNETGVNVTTDWIVRDDNEVEFGVYLDELYDPKEM